MLWIETVAQLGDSTGNLIEMDSFLLAISLQNKHCELASGFRLQIGEKEMLLAILNFALNLMWAASKSAALGELWGEELLCRSKTKIIDHITFFYVLFLPTTATSVHLLP
jgi:hypothetical protein